MIRGAINKDSRQPKYYFLGPKTPEEEYVSDIFKNPENYKFVKFLSKGGFGSVYLVTDKNDKKYAVKLFSSTNVTGAEYDQLIKEANLTRGVDLKNVVKVYGLFPIVKDNKNYLGIVEEYYVGKDLDYYTRHTDDLLSRRSMLILMYQVMNGIRELHENGIVHMDIKGKNIIVSGPTVKIVDLGISCKLGSGPLADLDKCKGIRGTTPYIAPEIFLKNYTDLKKADIWSFGITFYELIYGEFPYVPKSKNSTQDMINSQKTPPKYPEIRNFAGPINVVKYCLNYNPSDRPTSTQVLEFIYKEFYSGS